MDLAAYQAFTHHLQTNLESDPRVLGLVALGSMAERGRTPDEWSDHDFFVITSPGMQEDFRQNLAWLPDADQVVLHVRETAHGLKVLYNSGHLLEFAVFDLEELHLARVNDYRILLDRAGIADHMAQIESISPPLPEDPARQFRLFITILLVGAGRVVRGEVLSGSRFIKDFALANLLMLLATYLPSDHKGILDNLDPFRRFERVFPEIGAQINAILLLEPIPAAQGLLTLAETHLRDVLPDYPVQGVVVVRDYLERAGAEIVHL